MKFFKNFFSFIFPRAFYFLLGAVIITGSLAAQASWDTPAVNNTPLTPSLWNDLVGRVRPLINNVIINNDNVGIGTANPGAKLEVAGQIKITGGSPASEKVLMSDASGLASWQTVVSSQWTTAAAGDDIYYNLGNVGIGAANPGAKLEVAGQIKITGGSPGAGKILTSDASGLASWQTPPSSQWINAGNNIYYNLGNVGFGTIAPNRLLHIYKNGGDNAEIDIQSVAGADKHWAVYHDRVSSDLRIWNNTPGDEKNIFTITNEGNIGLGTTNPLVRLEVAGKVKIDDGSQGAGKVLTSDSSGLASWQDLPSADAGIVYVGSCDTPLAEATNGNTKDETCSCPSGAKYMFLTHNRTTILSASDGTSRCSVGNQNTTSVYGQATSNARGSSTIKTACSFICFK